MSLLTLAQAKSHLRIDGTASDADLTLKIEAAERSAIEYLGCNVYEDETDLARSIAAVPAELVAAKAAYDAAYLVAVELEDAELSQLAQEYAFFVYSRARNAATRTRNGVVVNELILSAMLLILGWLFETREDGAEMPRAARDLLHPYRCYA